MDVPPLPVWCEADEGQVRQVIWNLATNGLRAMPDGGRLRLGARREPGDAAGVLVVQDYGGEIRVASKPGGGTTVEVRLPARAAAAA